MGDCAGLLLAAGEGSRLGGPKALVVRDGELDPAQSLFLFTRSDTIYGGSNEVQRNIISERHWGLPRDTWVATS